MLVMVGNGVVAGANHIGQLSKDEATVGGMANKLLGSFGGVRAGGGGRSR